MRFSASTRALAAVAAGALWIAVAVAAAPRDASALTPLKEGDPLPHFTAPDMAGASVDTKALQGQKKTLLIDFWSIYCSSCIQEMPHIVALHQKYQAQGLQGIGIDLDAYGVARVKKFIDGLEFKIPYPTVIDAKMELKNKLGVSMLPTTILVDQSGVVRLFHVGYKPGFEKELEETIKAVLAGGKK
ncbi:MAG: TlpA family protein disulfide reductase [Deltaproteobacteria bacterium]|nr:TlpA family protein disulfide reductase [Deltaproteobacteria bacterium]